MAAFFEVVNTDALFILASANPTVWLIELLNKCMSSSAICFLQCVYIIDLVFTAFSTAATLDRAVSKTSDTSLLSSIIQPKPKISSLDGLHGTKITSAIAKLKGSDFCRLPCRSINTSSLSVA